MSINKWIYKYEITFTLEDIITEKRKFKSINEFLLLYGEVLNLNRQKCYRIRKKQYSIKKGTSASALKKYGHITINDIREVVPSIYVRCEC